MPIIDLPLELIDIICNLLNPSDLDIFSYNILLQNLNEKRLEKYWEKVGSFELVKLGKINGIKFLVNRPSKSEEITLSGINESICASIHPDINGKDYKMIMYACKYGHLNILEYLFERLLGYSPKTMDPSVKKLTKKHMHNEKYYSNDSEDNGSEESEDDEKGKNNDQKEEIDAIYLYSVALEKACKYNQMIIVKYLFDIGANIEYFDSNNIINACKNGNLEIVKFLVENGIDFHVYDDYPTIIAAEYGHFDIVKYLIGQGVNVHDIKNNCLTSAFTNDHTEIFEYMLSFDADITHSHYALRDAIKHNRFDKVKYIFQVISEKKEKNEKMGSTERINIETDPKLKSCMIEACISGNMEIIEFLVSKGISTKKCIREARKHDQLHVVKYLENLNSERIRGKPNQVSGKKGKKNI